MAALVVADPAEAGKLFEQYIIMRYKYDTPLHAIESLEKAYNNEDLEGIMNSKDFKTEAFMMLKSLGPPYNPCDDELLIETEKLLKLGLIESIQENGYPDFTNIKIELTEIQHIKNNIYFTTEKIIYPDSSFFENKIYLTLNNGTWKVATIEE